MSAGEKPLKMPLGVALFLTNCFTTDGRGRLGHHGNTTGPALAGRRVLGCGSHPSREVGGER
jgi:hypothetical protein